MFRAFECICEAVCVPWKVHECPTASKGEKRKKRRSSEKYCLLSERSEGGSILEKVPHGFAKMGWDPFLVYRNATLRQNQIQ